MGGAGLILARKSDTLAGISNLIVIDNCSACMVLHARAKSNFECGNSLAADLADKG